MNRVNSLRHLLLIPLLTVFVKSSDASGQEVDRQADSLRLDSLESIPFTYLPIESCGMFLVPYDQPFLLVQDSAAFAELLETKRFIGQCRDLVLPDVDYSRYAVVGFEIFVDCNALETIELVRDTAAGVYRIVVDIYDGGCRGMTSRGYWLQIPALKEGESLQLEEHGHDEEYPRKK